MPPSPLSGVGSSASRPKAPSPQEAKKKGWLDRFFGRVAEHEAIDPNPLLAFAQEPPPRDLTPIVNTVNRAAVETEAPSAGSSPSEPASIAEASPTAIPAIKPASKAIARPHVTSPAWIASRAALNPVGNERARLVRAAVIVASLLALSSLAVIAARRYPVFAGQARPAPTGTLLIDTRPAGSEVFVDDERRGVSPLTLELAPGAHTVVIRNGSDERTIPLTMAPGANISQYYEMKVEAAAVVGALSVTTDPPGALVSVDGTSRGVSPLTVTGLPVAEHRVTITTETGTTERVVAVSAGTTTEASFSLPRLAGPVGGWLSIASPFDVEVIERGEVVGSSAMARIMLSAGRHDIVLANRALGYSESRRIDVSAGRTIAIPVEPPKVPVSFNARPWADVLLDGANVGQTPIANIDVRVGSHDLVFRHPQLGERKQTVLVTVKGPNRISVDLSK